jgi:hypothetical protein
MEVTYELALCTRSPSGFCKGLNFFTIRLIHSFWILGRSTTSSTLNLLNGYRQRLANAGVKRFASSTRRFGTQVHGHHPTTSRRIHRSRSPSAQRLRLCMDTDLFVRIARRNRAPVRRKCVGGRSEPGCLDWPTAFDSRRIPRPQSCRPKICRTIDCRGSYRFRCRRRRSEHLLIPVRLARRNTDLYAAVRECRLPHTATTHSWRHLSATASRRNSTRVGTTPTSTVTTGTLGSASAQMPAATHCAPVQAILLSPIACRIRDFFTFGGKRTVPGISKICGNYIRDDWCKSSSRE